jgi:hypothetical protein
MGINWILLSEVFRNIAYGVSALVYAYVTLVNMWSTTPHLTPTVFEMGGL